MSIVPYVGGECKRGGLEIIHFFPVPPFQGLREVSNRSSTGTAKSLLRFRVTSVDAVSSSQHRVRHLAEFVRAVGAAHLRTAIERTVRDIRQVLSAIMRDTQATAFKISNPTPSVATIYTSVVGAVADGELVDDFNRLSRPEAFSETEVRGEEVVDGVKGGAEHE